MKLNKPYKNTEYAELACYCNSHNCHIEDKGEYLEAVENPVITPTIDEIARMREAYRERAIDSQTNRMVRKQANGTWTEDDMQAYLSLDATVQAYLDEHYPYPEEV